MKNPFILIAEDDVDDRMLLQSAFEEIKYVGDIKFLHDGAEVIKFVQKECKNPSALPNLILLDLNMPRTDGWQVLKEIKTHSNLKTIPIIVFSTTCNETEIEKCYQLGANSYVIKPTNYKALLKFVEYINLFWISYGNSNL